MSLLKWKEMAQKRSELGKKINEVRKTIKQKNISDQMGQVETAKLFEPITSGLRDLKAPKAPLRRLKKKGPIPDYGLEIGDDEEVPDYGLEDLFGEEIPPQNDKQVVPNPPSYEDVIKEIASQDIKYEPDNPQHEPEYIFDDIPIEEEKEEGLDNGIKINQTLDQFSLTNYDEIGEYLNHDETSDKDRKKIFKENITKC